MFSALKIEKPTPFSKQHSVYKEKRRRALYTVNGMDPLVLPFSRFKAELLCLFPRPCRQFPVPRISAEVSAAFLLDFCCQKGGVLHGVRSWQHGVKACIHASSALYFHSSLSRTVHKCDQLLCSFLLTFHGICEDLRLIIGCSYVQHSVAIFVLPIQESLRMLVVDQ